MDPAKAGRRGEDRDIAGCEAVNGLLVAIESDKLAIFGHVHPVGVLSLQAGKAVGEPFRKHVGHSDEFRRPAFGGQRVGGRARAASAAPHQCNANRVVLGRVHGGMAQVAGAEAAASVPVFCRNWRRDVRRSGACVMAGGLRGFADGMALCASGQYFRSLSMRLSAAGERYDAVAPCRRPSLSRAACAQQAYPSYPLDHRPQSARSGWRKTTPPPELRTRHAVILDGTLFQRSANPTSSWSQMMKRVRMRIVLCSFVVLLASTAWAQPPDRPGGGRGRRRRANSTLRSCQAATRKRRFSRRWKKCGRARVT